jgi:hypothetical protein
MTVLTAAGVQSEAHPPFAALHQMLRPVRERAAELPPTQRDALDGAFGVMQEIAPEHYRIAMASLYLVRGCQRTDSPASTTRQPRPTRRVGSAPSGT